MFGVSIKPVLRLIARHGEDIKHHRLPAPDAMAPWQADDIAARTAVTTPLKGLVKRITAARPDDDLPGGGFRAVAVLALPRPAIRPVPGDILETATTRWRVEAAAPLARHRSGELFETQLTAHGMKGNP